MSSHQVKYDRKPLPASFSKWAFILVGLGAVLVAASFFADHTRASFNSVVSFMFVLSIGIGAMFMIALEYVVGAVWSVPFRRIAELLTPVLFIAPIFALPIFFDLHSLYHWTHTEAVQADEILKNKAPYLNETFFLIRFVVMFVLIWLFKIVIVGKSYKMNGGDGTALIKSATKFSAGFMPLFAFTVTIMAIDFLMSLEPHWFSTIFGIYYFAGTFIASLAFIAVISIILNEKKVLVDGIGKDHYYNFGALLFAFTNFWAYIAFSQFMLIWYANIPEETFWFMIRMENGWDIASIVLILIHFVIPYALLVSQPSKSNPKRLKLMAIWLMIAHYYNLYWLVMPTFSKDAFVLSWNELGFPILSFGAILLVFTLSAKNKDLVPVGDPRLQRGVDFYL